MKKIKELFQKIESKNGVYSIGTAAIVIAIVIVINLIAGQLPQEIRNVDVSDEQIYDISKTSKKAVEKLEQDIVLNIVAEKSSVDERITTFVKKYAAMSKKISVKWVDPVLHPNALQEYETEGNSIVVSCEETDKRMDIPFADIIVYDQSAYYTTGTATEMEFDAQGQLTSAINYVTSDVSKKIYRTAGHGEASLSTSVTDLMEKANLTVEETNMVMQAAVPEDCDLLIMNAPSKDISTEEKDALTAYLKKGGKVMILLGGEEEPLPNLQTLMKEYGLEEQDGFVADTERCYQQNPYYLFPVMNTDEKMGEGMTSDMVLMVNAKGLMQVDPARDTIIVTPFMQTSSSGILVKDEEQTEGTYVLGATAVENITDGENEDDKKAAAVQSRLTVISGASMIDSQIIDGFSTLENLTLFMNTVTDNFEDVSNVSIPAKSLQVEYNTVQHSGMLSLLVVFGIPILVLICGFGVWWKRRKA